MPLRWLKSMIIIIVCGILTFIAYGFIRYNSKIKRLKHLFVHHRLHEQISLEIDPINPVYSHLPTQENNSYDQVFDTLADDIEVCSPRRTMINSNNRTDELVDDPFYIDEKQPIFSGEPTNNR